MPVPAEHEVLIEVHAAGVNRPDVMQRMGRYAPPPGASDLPGLEVAGTIAKCGASVSNLEEDMQVCALVPGGGYAEFCVAPAVQCLPVPSGLSMLEAASLPETYFTVWFNLFMRNDLPKARSLLVHGGSSGIGTAAIQLACAFGVPTYATAGSDDKCVVCEKLGATRAINYAKQDFVEVIKELTGGAGVDMVLDMVGGDYFARNMEALARNGTLVMIAFLKGGETQLDLMPLLTKQLTVNASTMRPQPVAVKGKIAKELADQVWPLFADGKIKPVIHEVLGLGDAASAHKLMEDGGHIGKIMLAVKPM